MAGTTDGDVHTDAVDDMITVDNYSTRLSTFDQHMICKPFFNHLYGLVDMGRYCNSSTASGKLFLICQNNSNGIRFSISDLAPPESRLLHCLYRQRAGISLYDDLHESTPGSQPGHFSQNTIKAVGWRMASFKQTCDRYGVADSHISVFATEAMRTAKNQDEMLREIRATSGFTVSILSPQVESLFGAMGARSGFHRVNGLFMDMGGGSLQITYVNSHTDGANDYSVETAQMARSMPYGAAKLTADMSDPETARSTIAEVRANIKNTLDNMRTNCPGLDKQLNSHEGLPIYLCGGGFRGFGTMLMHTDIIQPYPFPTVGGYRVSGKRILETDKLLLINLAEGKIFGMSKRRRQQFPAVVTVVQAIAEAIPRISDIYFCGGGNHEGVLFMKLPTEVREVHPLSVVKLAVSPGDIITAFDPIAQMLISAYPPGLYLHESITEHMHFIGRNIWTGLGFSDDINSSKTLHQFTSGQFSRIPGLTHETRAGLALTLCARWGNSFGPADKQLRDDLIRIGGPHVGFWCDYIGAVARAIAIILPVPPVHEVPLNHLLSFSAVLLETAVPKNVLAVNIHVRLQDKRDSVDVDQIKKLFAKVGKGMHAGCKVEVEVKIGGRLS